MDNSCAVASDSVQSPAPKVIMGSTSSSSGDSGPLAGQLLGDYGAEVIKVEAPDGGDPMRRWGLTRDGESLWWAAIARNKKSVAVDLRAAEGRDIVRRLAAS